MRGLLLILFLLAAHAGLVAGQVPLDRSMPSQPRPGEPARTFFSTSRRFMVAGFSPETATQVARWAEDVARRLEGVLGPIPLERGWYLEIRAVPGASVVRAQGWVDGLLQQRLEVDPGEQGDQEDALEGLVWLLLNRWPVARQEVGARVVALATVPDWLAVGLAQHLYLELRNRNASAVQTRWLENQLTPWSDLVEREILPAGRWSEKGELGLLVGWLLDRHARFDEAWLRWAKGQRLSAEEVAQRLAGLPTAAEAAQNWEVWLAGEQDRRRHVRGLTPDQVDEFRELTTFDATELQTVQAEVAGPLTLADLVARRRAPWVPTLAKRRSLRMQMAMVGRAPEWQDVGRQYLDVLQGLAGQGRGRWGGLIGRGASRATLEDQLADADASCVRLRSEVVARTAYLDELEARQTPAGSGAAVPPVDEAVRLYMDTVEQLRAVQSP